MSAIKKAPTYTVPAWVDDYGFSASVFRVFGRLVRRDGGNGCFESIPAMASGCKLEIKTVRKALRELESAGIIEYVGKYKNKTNIYKVLKR